MSEENKIDKTEVPKKRTRSSVKKKTNSKPKLQCLIHPKGVAELAEDNFYVCKGESIFAQTGKILICKSCCARLYQKYYTETQDPKLSMYYTCRKMDIAFINKVYETAFSETDGDWTKILGMYMKNYSSLGTVNGWNYSFDNSEDCKMNSEEVEEDKEVFKLSKKKRRDLTLKWGVYEDLDLEFLEEKYIQWTTRHKCEEYSEEILFQQLSIKELEIRKGRESGDNVDKQVDAFQKLLKDANVKPSDIKNSKGSDATACWGTFIADIEKHKPAEYFEDKKIYQDFDSLREYAERFIYRPLKNLLLGSKDFDEEYSIRSDE